MKQVNIKISAIKHLDSLTDNDRELPLEVIVSIENDVNTELIADAALDVFHSKVPIDDLEAFHFEVWLEGKLLNTNPLHDSYSLSEKGYLL